MFDVGCSFFKNSMLFANAVALPWAYPLVDTTAETCEKDSQDEHNSLQQQPGKEQS
jgi:hypothetical protein